MTYLSSIIAVTKEYRKRNNGNLSFREQYFIVFYPSLWRNIWKSFCFCIRRRFEPFLRKDEKWERFKIMSNDYVAFGGVQWYPVVRNGTLWRPVASSDIVWDPVGSCGVLWCSVWFWGWYGILWHPMASYGVLWRAVASRNFLWRFLYPVGICGVLSPSVVTSGVRWYRVGSCGVLWDHVVPIRVLWVCLVSGRPVPSCAVLYSSLASSDVPCRVLLGLSLQKGGRAP